MPKIERTSSLTSTPKAQAVTRTATPATGSTAAAPKGAVTDYAGQAAPPKELVPRGKQVTTSASPSALWGEAPATNELDVDAFQKLSPAEQQAQLTTLREERQQLSAQIQARLAKLDIKWNNSRLVTRTEALRDYQEQTKHLDPATKQELDGLLHRAEASQRSINTLRAKIDRLPKTPEAKKAQAALRTQLAKELRAARAEQSKVVKAATTVVDQQGLKADRLAVTEQVIDPSAPKPGSGDTLLEKVTRFLHLDGFLDLMGRLFDPAKTQNEQLVQGAAQRLDESRKSLESRIQSETLAQTRADLAGLISRGTGSPRPA